MNYILFEKDRYHQQREMRAWCEEQFGEGKWIFAPYPKDWTGMPNWTIHSMFGNTTFAFKNDRDYEWFLLKWA